MVNPEEFLQSLGIYLQSVKSVRLVDNNDNLYSVPYLMEQYKNHHTKLHSTLLDRVIPDSEINSILIPIFGMVKIGEHYYWYYYDKVQEPVEDMMGFKSLTTIRAILAFQRVKAIRDFKHET